MRGVRGGEGREEGGGVERGGLPLPKPLMQCKAPTHHNHLKPQGKGMLLGKETCVCRSHPWQSCSVYTALPMAMV